MSLQRPPTHERGLREGPPPRDRTDPRSPHVLSESLRRARRAARVRGDRSGTARPIGLRGGPASDWASLPRPRRESAGAAPGAAECAVPESAEPLQALIQEARALAWIDGLSVRSEVVGVAESDAQSETPVAEVVQRDRLPRDLLDASARERSDHRPDSKAVRHRSDGAERHPRVGHGAVRGRIRDPIPQEQTVPTPGLSNPRELGQEPADSPTRRTVPSTVRAS